MRRDWLITYDIRDPKRLRKIARLLEGYGTRLQYSVFRIKGNDRDLERVRWQITQILDEADSILYFRFCPSCSVRIQSWNETLQWASDREPRHVII